MKTLSAWEQIMDSEIERQLEAILMVADEPQSMVSLATVLERPVADVKAALANLVADFDGEGGTVRRGFELREVGGGWRIYVREDFDELVRDVVHSQNATRLSQPALETLSVIAYKQPVTRSQVSGIRAVNVDTVIRTLVGRGLITEMGTEPETGAILYGTTDLLLTHLGIDSLDQLPPISQILDDGADGFDDAR
jgi:segregation and condensation protein B